MMHPETELRLVDKEIGFGVFATEPIPRGTVAWTLCRFDLIFTPHEAAALPAPYQTIVASSDTPTPMRMEARSCAGILGAMRITAVVRRRSASIARGTIIWALDSLDRVLTPAEIAALPAALALDTERHLWLNRDGNYVLAWDLARFVNHSCRPNCVTTEFGCEIAVTDIALGDQITNDYADLGMLPSETLACDCGAPACRQVMASGQAGAIRAALAESVAQAIACAGAVKQPLWSLLPRAARDHLLAA